GIFHPALHVVRLFGVAVQIILNGATVTGDHGVLGGVDSYAIQPGVEGAVAAKLRQGSVSLDEGFLGDILCFRRVTHIAHDQLDEFVLVLEHQRIECPLVPALHAAYQAQITCIGAHAPPLYPAQRAAVPCAEYTVTSPESSACVGGIAGCGRENSADPRCIAT